MEDPETSAATADLFRQVTGHSPAFYGGGAMAGGFVDTSGEWQLYQAISDWVARNPAHHHRSTLGLGIWPTKAAAIAGVPSANWLPGTYIGHVPLPQADHDSPAHGNPWDFDLLATWRSDVASLARFSQRLDHAAWHLSLATEEHDSPGLWQRPGVRMRRSPRSWIARLTRDCFARWTTTKRMLLLDWSIPERVEPLYRTAFWSLCELSPANSQLKVLFVHDRFRACHELVRHVDAYARQLELASELSEELESEGENALAREDRQRLRDNQEQVLEQAGERLSLTEAAGRLGISRQALHKKIRSDAALGVMVEGNLVIPGIQLVEGANGWTIIPGLRPVLRLFGKSGAGSWSALQYIVELDPALGAIPIELLRDGDTNRVVAMARGFLGLDEA